MSPIKTPKNQQNRADDLMGKPSFSEEDEDNIAGEQMESISSQHQQLGLDDNSIEHQDTFEEECSSSPNSPKLNNNVTDSSATEGDSGSPSPSDCALIEEDLPSEIVRVMGKACTQILVTQPDEECCLTYLGLLERVLSHEAFTQNDKRRMQSWKTQCQKLARQLAMNRKLGSIEKGPKK